MPRFRLFVHATLFCLLALGCFGCASKNDQAPNLNALGQHPSDWLVAHRAAYQNAPNQCVECHGADLKGGISRVDCFNQAGVATCHAGGHGPRLANHPIPFKDPALHGPVAKQNLAGCQLTGECHAGATPGIPGSNPRFNARIGTLINGCEDCHPVGAGHPEQWRGHNTAGNLTGACTLCHGALFIGGSGPACQSCHNTPPAPGTCSSCHASPPNGAAPNALPNTAAVNARPNRPGSHPAHNALPLVQNSCSVCHLGGGSGTAVHYANVVFGNTTVALRPTYDAKSGRAGYNRAGQTCANVKCHGGITTPSWGGTINVTTQCRQCHQDDTARPAPTQFNSFFSGRHALHLGNQVGADCPDCHDMSGQTPPSHFSNLSTAGFEQTPASTVRAFINYQPPSCTPPAIAPQTSIGGCHLPEIGTQRWTP